MKTIKLIIASLLFISLAVHAEIWLEMPNQAGGKILLLQSKCDGNGRLVLATTDTGDTVSGCWYAFADMIHVVWESGKTSSYEPKYFVAKERK